MYILLVQAGIVSTYSYVRGWSRLEDGGLVGVTENKDQNLVGAADRRGAEEKMACYLDLACHLGIGLSRRVSEKKHVKLRAASEKMGRE